MMFDRTFLPRAECELVVLSDTHYLLHPELQGGEWQSILEFPGRAERALRLAAALGAEVAVHLGDVTHEYPETGEAVKSREGAKAQFAELGLRPYMAPGNMDIGDKPDATSPAEWVTPETLAAWDAAFGRSWQSFDRGGVHGVVLNTCIMNGPLPEAEAQRRWLEADLEEHKRKRIFVFLHHPVFFVDPSERATGMYNSLDEPARGWLLGLFSRYGVEVVFAGHTHFVAINRVEGTRFYTAPSTTTSRAGLVEAFTVLPPDRGRSDLAKLGFYLVRTGVGSTGTNERGGATRVHLIRTGLPTGAAGAAGAADAADPRKLVLTLTSPDLPRSPVGVFASHPIGHMTPGPVFWPSVVRQRVRDDWRMVACLELGAARLRVPESDLDEHSERDRLAVLRAEGVGMWAYWLWTERLDLVGEVSRHRAALDGVELLLPGRTTPDVACLEQLARVREMGVPVTLSTAQRTEVAGNQYHRRTRVGYDAGELLELDAWMEAQGASIDRAVVRLSAQERPWETVEELRGLLPLKRVDGIDLALDFPDQDEIRHAALAAEVMFAAAGLPGARLWLGPLLDLDRSMDASHGLLDRLSNPRQTFNVVRTLNTVLFAQVPDGGYEREAAPAVAGGSILALTGGRQRYWLCLPGDDGGSIELPELSGLSEGEPVRCYHLVGGTSVETDGTAEAVARALGRADGPALLVVGTGEGR